MLVSQRVSYVCFSCWNTHWERPWFGASLCFNAEDFHFMASLLAFASLSPRLRRWGLSIGPVHWGPLGGRMTCFPWLVSEESNRISPIVDDFAVEDGHVLRCWILPCFIGRVFRHISFGASPGHKMPDLHRFFFPFFQPQARQAQVHPDHLFPAPCSRLRHGCVELVAFGRGSQRSRCAAGTGPGAKGGGVETSAADHRAVGHLDRTWIGFCGAN